MRVVFIGTNKVSLSTGRTMIDSGHEVVFIEKDKDKINQLADEIDCGFIHGDGSAPDKLEEVGPEQTEVLFCMTDNDKDNIIAGLVGRSLGFDKIIIKIEDFAYEHICEELGLEDIIVPTRTISRYLVDMVTEKESSELSSAIKDDARFYIFIAGEEEADKKVKELDLPEEAGIVCYYRDKQFNLARPDSPLKKGDEVVILTSSDMIDSLREKWPNKYEE